MKITRPYSLLLSALILLGVPFIASAQPGPLPEDPAYYSSEQAERGEELYQQNCLICHGENLNDGEFGAPLKGTSFSIRWAGTGMDALLEQTREMPPGQSNRFSGQQYADMIAFILQENNIPAGDEALPSESTELANLFLPSDSLNSSQLVRRRGRPSRWFCPRS